MKCLLSARYKAQQPPSLQICENELIMAMFMHGCLFSSTFLIRTKYPNFYLLLIPAGADAEAVRREMRSLHALFNELNPFAASHHSDSVSLASSPTSPEAESLTFRNKFEETGRFTSSRQRASYLRQFAEYYGLQYTDTQTMNMLGELDAHSNVILSQIWPASYQNWGRICSKLALPPKFHSDVRNFLLLPKWVEAAFDQGHIIFVPSPDKITIRVLSRPQGLPPLDNSLQSLDGRALIIPRAGEGHVPYKRLLGFFAYMASTKAPTLELLQHELNDALSASQSEEGNAALTELIRKWWIVYNSI